ncbi:hypothetical protein [Saccharibacillus sp. JS10]|uniref:hypothetical protein n=1 Tax=Saccharibacillus sp. JS10 TaxID=2950552 RepID=UPI00210B66E4|nr:hypothetical protein [Saccharibacillus sp. JS10]MCQ4085865.1 hypothetical protein [Saccharibacillus sp. JS10]
MISLMDYAKARKDIDAYIDQFEVPSNDNKIGRIGEYYAKRYFDGLGLKLTWAKKNNEVYDMIVNGDKCSVKTITQENSDQSTHVKLNGHWDRLIVVILDNDLMLKSIFDFTYDEICSYGLRKNTTWKKSGNKVLSKEDKVIRYKVSTRSIPKIK